MTIKAARVTVPAMLYNSPAYYSRNTREPCIHPWRLAGTSVYRMLPDNWRIL